MSSQELDKLFRDKLETMKKAPSDAAWSRVQAKMAPGHKKWTWAYVKVAAAILLLITFIGFFKYSLWQEEASELATHTPPAVTPPTIQAPGIAKADEPREAQNNPPLIAKAEKPSHTSSPLVKPTVTAKDAMASHALPGETPAGPGEVQAQEEVEGEPPLDPLAKEIDQYEQENKTILDNEEVLVASNTAEKSIEEDLATGRTLVFNIEEFDMKTAVTSEEETPDDPKKKGLKRIMNVIKSVKEGEGGLAELREAKNNLLALNTKEREYDHSK